MTGVLYAKVNGDWVPVPSQASSVVQIQQVWPAGSIRTTIAAFADPGWLLFGQTVANAETMYPALWAVAPTAWKSGSSLVIPSDVDCGLRGSSTAGLGAISGQNTKTIDASNLPVHSHTINHDHAAVNTGLVSADHTHSGTTAGFSTNHWHHPAGGQPWIVNAVNSGGGHNLAAGGAGNAQIQTGTGYVNTDHTHNFTTGGISANHSHVVDLPNFAGSSGTVGSGVAFNVQDAAINVRFQIKAH